MTSRSRAAIGGLLAAVALGGPLSACGGEDSTQRVVTDDAGELCRDYRLAVTAVRFNGTPEEQGSDFTVAANAARAAAEGTVPDHLSARGPEYLDKLGQLAAAYESAANASIADDQDAYFAALDVAEPADDALDELAGDGGLEGCALGKVAEGEDGYSQSGFPALAVPDDAVPVPPDGDAVAYRLPEATMRLVGIETAVAGTVSAADSAAAFESALGEEFASIEVIGESGNDLVPMTEYRYEFEVEGGRVPGIAHVFSGQGMIWALDCAGLEPAEAVSSDLAADCDRAVETLGFLMF